MEEYERATVLAILRYTLNAGHKVSEHSALPELTDSMVL